MTWVIVEQDKDRIILETAAGEYAATIQRNGCLEFTHRFHKGTVNERDDTVHFCDIDELLKLFNELEYFARDFTD